MIYIHCNYIKSICSTRASSEVFSLKPFYTNKSYCLSKHKYIKNMYLKQFFRSFSNSCELKLDRSTISCSKILCGYELKKYINNCIKDILG
jgi:hypothetical protein